jgi:arylsulfatase A-like enzyme
MLLLLAACHEPEDSPRNKEPTGETDQQPDPDTTTDTTEETGTTDTGEPYVGPQSVLQFDGDPPTNLLVISLDTTRRDYIGRFAGNGNTPNLDLVLATGVALDDHRSCSSWTAPSMTCVTTGLTPFELGWWPWASDPAIPGSDPQLPTLAGQLHFQKAYRTSLVTANTVFDSDLNFTRGFEFVYRPSWQSATDVTDQGLAAANELLQLGEPFYLHVHYIDPHGNYCPPEEYVDHEDYIDIGEDICWDMYDLAWGDYWYAEQDWRDAFKTDLAELYDAEVEYWDAQFGRLWQRLDEMGALDDTLVMFVTDHGEQLLERGGLGHGLTLGAEENRATAGFWAKNIVPQAWPGNTVHQDLAATLQTYYGVTPPTPSSGVVVGMAPEDRFVRSMLYWGPGAVRLAVVRDQQQLTYDWWGELHFYDHDTDPAGLLDYYDVADPDVQAFWPAMEAFIDEVHTQWPSAGEPVLPY